MLKASSMGGIVKAKKINDEYKNNPNKCVECKEPILKQNSWERLADIKKKKFCDRSCSAKYHNRKRKKYTECNICGVKIPCKRKRCDSCLKSYVSKIGHILKKDTTHPKIRSHARTVFKSHNETVKCEHCSFDKFTEICHIKEISGFSGDTPLSLINNIKNLKQLCPNCHWEFDNIAR